MVHSRQELHDDIIQNVGPVGPPVGVFVDTYPDPYDTFEVRAYYLVPYLLQGDMDDALLLLDLYIDPINEPWFDKPHFEISLRAQYRFEIACWLQGWIAFRPAVVEEAISQRIGTPSNWSHLLNLARAVEHPAGLEWIRHIASLAESQNLATQELGTSVAEADHFLREMFELGRQSYKDYDADTDAQDSILISALPDARAELLTLLAVRA